MVIVELSAGLGNQFYQYAYAKWLANERRQLLVIDTSNYYLNNFRQYGLQHFRINAIQIHASKYNNNFLIKSFFKSTYTNTSFVDNNPIWLVPNIDSFTKKHISLVGTWPFPNIFASIRQQLLIDFSLKKKLQSSVMNIINQVKNNHSVSIHIRRGDYKTSPEAAKVFILLKKKYYDNAIAYIHTKIENPHFYIFTDDIVLVEEWFTQKNYKIVSNNNLKDFEELEIMKNCQHNIIANSTFSWWAAWLNINPSKIVIQPKVWYKDVELQFHYQKNTIIGQIDLKIDDE